MNPSTYQRSTYFALVALIGIIITGASVRLTNSGLGCDDWPNCNSEKLIDVSSAHAAIEQVNRLLTGVVVLAVAVAVLGSYLRTPRRRDLVWWSWSLVVGVFANAFLGAVTVWVDLHPYAVQGHLLLSMALIASGAVLVRRSSEPDGVRRERVVSSSTSQLVRGLALGTTVAVVTGTVVTGAGPHAGDENAVRLNVDIPSAARVHGASVIATLLVAVLLVLRCRRSQPDREFLRAGLSRWLTVAVMQAVIGYVQYFTGVPELLVLAHVAGASVLYVATTQLVLDTARPAVLQVR
jgi:cytochrome c oxidase assembly protein subunit 15